jgi:hypothetical protein
MLHIAQPVSIILTPPWEANSHSASEEIFLPLWNPKVHYIVSQQPVPGHCPEPDESCPQFRTPFNQDPF